MCTGRTHSASGAVLGLAAGIVLRKAVPADFALSGFTAGMALLPDLDSCGSCASRSLGFISGALSHVIRKVTGGHRHGSHSLAGIAVFTGLAVLACWFRRDYAGMAGLALLLVIAVAGAVEALHLARSHVADAAGVAVAAAVIWHGYGLPLIPLAVLLGCTVHGVFDSMTGSGVNWLWPWQRRFHVLPRPLQFTTGTRPETLIVFPLLVLALAVLAVQAADPALLASGWHAAVSRL